MAKKPPSFNRLNACAYKITWDNLYRKLYCPFTDDQPVLNEYSFIQALFPSDFSEVFLVRNNKFQNKYASVVCRATDDASPRFKEARNYLIELKTDDYEKYRYNTCPVILHFQKKWEEMVPLLTSEECNKKEKLSSELNDLLESIPDNDEPLNMYQRLYPLYEDGHFSQVLSILSVMSSTLFHYTAESKNISEEDSELHTIVLPPLPSQEISLNLEQARAVLDDDDYSLEKYRELLSYSLRNADEKIEAQYLLYKKAVSFNQKQKYHSLLIESANAGYEPALLLRKNEEAESLLENAVNTYQDPTAVDKSKILKCCQQCEKILRLNPIVSKDYRGPASFILYKYSLSGDYTSPSGETAYQFLEISHNCGYTPATTAWEKHNTFSIIPKYEASAEKTSGICYFNTDNIYTEIFKKTIPETWRTDNCNLLLQDASALFEENILKRILLVDDDFEKNLSDLFDILQTIKESSFSHDDLNLEIFIRHKSDTARLLIDTALSHMDDCLLPIYMINDDKIAAQQLLSQHPLFYPVAGAVSSSSAVLPEKRPTLHFVVLGTSDVAEWLIREAFWMMGDKNNALETRITLLAPNGKSFIAQLKSRLPGMIKDRFNISGIEIPEITGKSIDFDSNQLLEQVAEIIKKTPYCYFAVATPNDSLNLTLAMRIREASIRTCISQSMDRQLNTPFPVAFLCRHDKMAWLSQSMVIEKENQGNKWFNTWSLIPFGEISNRYTWDEIAGGTFQQLALCIHYQYSGISPEAVQFINNTPIKPAEMDGVQKKAYNAKKDFFARQYNQDSSYSLALSLPYRIFQFQDIYGNRITPIAWSILDKTVFSNAEQLSLLAKRVDNFFIKERDWKQVAEWEHARWVKWMISRGWLPATFDQAVFAYQNGNPRQQLFVARLHPCICSYEELAKLTTILMEKCGIKKDFYTADLDNVKATKSILSLEWVKDKIIEPSR